MLRFFVLPPFLPSPSLPPSLALPPLINNSLSLLFPYSISPTHTQFDGDGVEEEADSVVNQVLTEIGLDLGAKMTDAPTGKLSRKEEEEVEAAEDKAALAALEKLLPSMP